MEATEAVRRMTPGRTGELSYLHWHGDVSTPPVVLLQPVNTAAAVWDQVAPLLGGRASYAIDYRGHGQSTATGPYLPSDYADDAIAMMDAAGIGVAHLVGGSIGGAVSVEMAMRCRGRIASISLFGAAVHLGYSTDIVDTMLAGIRAHGVEQWFAMHAHEIVGSASVDGVPARLAELAGGRPLEKVA
ncbi:MAG: alpha/beta hydrolase [Pseudonocardiales bacterium]|nr:alpha/beta hydrolase [Pseudonocardiales bacterium]